MPCKSEDGNWEFTLLELIRLRLASIILGEKLWKWGFGQIRETLKGTK
jgi:hypothetical protein